MPTRGIWSWILERAPKGKGKNSYVLKFELIHLKICMVVKWHKYFFEVKYVGTFELNSQNEVLGIKISQIGHSQKKF